MTKRTLNRGHGIIEANEVRYEFSPTQVNVEQGAEKISTITITGFIDSISAIDEDGESVMTNTDGYKWEPAEQRYVPEDEVDDSDGWEQVPGKMPGIMWPKKRSISDLNWAKEKTHAYFDGKQLVISTDSKESEMKAVYNFYGVNRRTGAFLHKQVVGMDYKERALQAVLLEHADEIKLTLGDPKECVFVLDGILDFEPIEDKTD